MELKVKELNNYEKMTMPEDRVNH